MLQKIRLTFEKVETLRIGGSRSTVIGFCPRCRETGEMIFPNILAAIAGTSERSIFRLIESGQIFFVEDERVYACTGCYRSIEAGEETGLVLEIGGTENEKTS